MRRFLMHVLPGGFHRIRHYGLFANAGRRENLARARELLNVEPEPVAASVATAESTALSAPTFVCPDCGAPMSIIEVFRRAAPIRAPPRIQSRS